MLLLGRGKYFEEFATFASAPRRIPGIKSLREQFAHLYSLWLLLTQRSMTIRSEQRFENAFYMQWVRKTVLFSGYLSLSDLDLLIVALHI